MYPETQAVAKVSDEHVEAFSGHLTQEVLAEMYEYPLKQEEPET